MNRDELMKVAAELNCKVTPSSENVVISCPLSAVTHQHGSDKHPSLSIKVVEKGPSPWKCWACQYTGASVTGLLFTMMKMRFRVKPEFLDWVKDVEKEDPSLRLHEAMVHFSKEADESFGKVPEDEITWDDSEMAYFEKRLPKYFLERGLSIETARAWDLMYDPREHRLIFPVRRMDQKLVGAFGRALPSCTGPKYKNYLNFKPNKYLYGENMVDTAHVCSLPGSEWIILVEGAFDVLRFWDAGYRNVVGGFGVATSQERMEKLLLWQRPICLFQDFDSAGEHSRKAFQELLKGRLPLLKPPRLPEGYKDPGDCTPEMLKKTLEKAELVLF